MTIAEPPIPHYVSPNRTLAALRVVMQRSWAAWYLCNARPCEGKHIAHKTLNQGTYTLTGACDGDTRYGLVLARLNTDDILRPMLVVIEAEGQ